MATSSLYKTFSLRIKSRSDIFMQKFKEAFLKTKVVQSVKLYTSSTYLVYYPKKTCKILSGLRILLNREYSELKRQ